MEKIVIIGGGASGLATAIYASRNGKKVLLIERNEEPAKKILITGSGKCNYFNEDQSLCHYHTEKKEALEKILTEENRKEILSFFRSIGIVPQIKNKYYYPFSMQATSMKEALLAEAKALNIQIRSSFYVNEIIKKENKFYINPENENIEADFILLATGSKAAPKTGSDGIGYRLATTLGHSLTEVLPALSPLYGEESYFKLWDGVRANGEVSLYVQGKFIRREIGEIQLTKYGVSGICVFNLSGAVAKALSKKKNVELRMNFMPFLEEEASLFLDKRNLEMKNRTIEQLLEGFLSYKLIHVLLKEAGLLKNQKWENLTQKEKKALSCRLTQFTISIKDTASFDKAQVCTGGIPLSEIDPLTMESQMCKNLYLAGELLDVDGDCGGYNLALAFITGMIAGKNIGGKHD